MTGTDLRSARRTWCNAVPRIALALAVATVLVVEPGAARPAAALTGKATTTALRVGMAAAAAATLAPALSNLMDSISRALDSINIPEVPDLIEDPVVSAGLTSIILEVSLEVEIAIRNATQPPNNDRCQEEIARFRELRDQLLVLLQPHNLKPEYVPYVVNQLFPAFRQAVTTVVACIEGGG